SISRRFYAVIAGYYKMKATPRVRKVALLGKFAYPALRLDTLKHGEFSYSEITNCDVGTWTTEGRRACGII
ncbi:hypothetical protein, partial [Pseudoalteromonas citrea]